MGRPALYRGCETSPWALVTWKKDKSIMKIMMCVCCPVCCMLTVIIWLEGKQDKRCMFCCSGFIHHLFLQCLLQLHSDYLSSVWHDSSSTWVTSLQIESWPTEKDWCFLLFCFWKKKELILTNKQSDQTYFKSRTKKSIPSGIAILCYVVTF